MIEVFSNIKKFLILSLLLTVQVSFAQIDTVTIKENNALDWYEKMYKIPKSDTVWKTLTLEKKWLFVSDSIGGCLTGGEYCIESNCGNSACCFNRNPYWNVFLGIEKKELITFLINNLSDSSISKVHTCPYSNATKGELATYCLQHILKVNWYDLSKSYKKYDDGTLKPKDDFYSLQEVLQKLLADKKELEKMKALWIKLENEK